MLAALSLASAPLAHAHAQATVAGVVTDSLAGAPLASATVQLVLASNPAGSIRSVMSDSSGRFHLDGVPTGRYLLAFTHPRLEELGVDVRPRTVDVASGAPSGEYDLAIPGGRTLGRALCGARRDSSGVIAGRVLTADAGEPVTSGTVTASWVELRIVLGTSVQRVPRTLRANVSDAGRFAICGVPTDIGVRVVATAGSARSGEVELQAPPFALSYRQLFVAPSVLAAASPAGDAGVERGRARVIGHVRGPNGRPIDRAQVLLVGSGVSAVSDANGAFALDSLPAGTRAIEVRALGYVPTHRVLDLRSGVVSTADLSLTERVATLEAVTVYGKAPNRGEAGAFAERARGMFGKFFTGDQVAKSGVTSLPELFHMVPGFRVTQAAGTFLSTVVGRGEGLRSACLPAVYLDGMYIADGATSLDNLVRPSEVGGIEAYADASVVPVEFRHGSCGSIVIWTKVLVPDALRAPAGP